MVPDEVPLYVVIAWLVGVFCLAPFCHLIAIFAGRGVAFVVKRRMSTSRRGAPPSPSDLR
jgi:hypothetical protein